VTVGGSISAATVVRATNRAQAKKTVAANKRTVIPEKLSLPRAAA
jgi:hypothetical protein